jgi:hypothetical protein
VLTVQWLGYVGLAALVLSRIPQSLETMRVVECTVNGVFLVLFMMGNVSPRGVCPQFWQCDFHPA